MRWLAISGLARPSSATGLLSLTGLTAELGVLRDAGRRGLDAMEAAGLVRVDRHAGRCPMVTILDAGAVDEVTPAESSWSPHGHRG